MANARLVCTACGHELSPDDRFCAKCGTKVEGGGNPPGTRATGSEPTTCEVCGHRNAHDGPFCEACGAKLPGRVVARDAAPPRSEQKSAARPSQGKREKHKPSSSAAKLQPWHYAAGGAIVALIVLFVYTEVQRDTPPPSSAAPMQFPATQTPSSPPSKEILEAIDRLQKTVADNPNDVGAKLLLANALHDAAMHDGSLFPRAIEAYKTYLKEKPGDPNARVDLGICYFELGKIDSTRSASLFAQAISEMEATMKNNPKHQAGAFNLGIVYLYAGDIEASNKWLKKTVELNADSDLGKRAEAILKQHSQAG